MKTPHLDNLINLLKTYDRNNIISDDGRSQLNEYEAIKRSLSMADVRGSLLQRAVEALDDYLNAGSKDTRANAADKSKQIYQEYYGKEYRNRNDR